MNRRLVLQRHGRTAWNLERRGQGHADVALDEVGHGQAASAAPLVAAFQPAMLWCSDLSRAAQTAAYVAKETGLEPREDARFREFSLGERTGMTMPDFEATFPDEYTAFRAGDWSVVPGAEDNPTVAARFGAGIADVLAGLGTGQTAVVVSHGTAIKVGIGALLGWPLGQSDTLAALANCAWAELQETATTGRFRLVGYNVGHPRAAG